MRDELYDCTWTDIIWLKSYSVIRKAESDVWRVRNSGRDLFQGYLRYLRMHQGDLESAVIGRAPVMLLKLSHLFNVFGRGSNTRRTHSILLTSQSSNNGILIKFPFLRMRTVHVAGFGKHFGGFYPSRGIFNWNPAVPT